MLWNLESRFPILTFHCPLGLSPQLNSVIIFHFVRFLIGIMLSNWRRRVSGDVVSLGAFSSKYRSPRLEKSRSTSTWTCSRKFISQLALSTVKKTSEGIVTLQGKEASSLPAFYVDAYWVNHELLTHARVAAAASKLSTAFLFVAVRLKHTQLEKPKHHAG